MKLSEYGKNIVSKDETIARIIDIEACEKELLKTVSRSTNKKAVNAVKLLTHLQRRIIEKRSVLDTFEGKPGEIYIKISARYVAEEIGVKDYHIKRANSTLKELGLMTPFTKTFTNKQGHWQNIWALHIYKEDMTKLVVINSETKSIRELSPSEENAYYKESRFRTFVNKEAFDSKIKELNEEYRAVIADPKSLYNQNADNLDESQEQAKEYFTKRSKIIREMDVSKLRELFEESLNPLEYDEDELELTGDCNEESDLWVKVSVDMQELINNSTSRIREAINRKLLYIFTRYSRKSKNKSPKESILVQ